MTITQFTRLNQLKANVQVAEMNLQAAHAERNAEAVRLCREGYDPRLVSIEAGFGMSRMYQVDARAHQPEGGRMTDPKEGLHPRDVQAGDAFVDPVTGRVIWTAVRDALTVGPEVHLDVRFALDGGRGTRVWDDQSDLRLSIARPS